MREELQHEAEGLPVQIVSYVEDSVSAMAAADLIVCMAGYNTLAEVLHLRRKALVVPRAGPSAEQQMRCRLFAQRNLIDVLYPGQLSPQTLGERLLLDLERNEYPSHDGVVDTHGVHRVAALLADADLWDRLARAARCTIEAHFAIGRNSRELVTLFQRGGGVR